MRNFESLRGRQGFQLCIRRGRKGRQNALTVFRFTPRRDSSQLAKVGMIVPKTVGKAVVRNRLRRRCRALLATGGVPIAARDWYVIQFRPPAAELTYAALKEQLASALQDAAAGQR